MPALVWRTSPARSIRRCDTICASAGFSFRVGRKYWLIRILAGSLLGASGVAADYIKRGLQRQTSRPWLVLHRAMPAHSTRQPGENANARANLQAQRKQAQRQDRDR